MPLYLLAPGFLPHYQFPSDPPISLCNSTAMSYRLAQLFWGMPPQIIPSHAPLINQPIGNNFLTFPLIQSKDLPKHDAEILQPHGGSSSLQHQARCVQSIHQTIQQFHQHLKAEQLERKTLQLIALQLPNNFALLRYLLFSSVGPTSSNVISVKNSATSPLINPNPNHLPALRTHNFVVLPRMALWDPLERKQIILQMPTSSLLPTHWRTLHPQRGTSRQECQNSKKYSKMK